MKQTVAWAAVLGGLVSALGCSGEPAEKEDVGVSSQALSVTLDPSTPLYARSAAAGAKDQILALQKAGDSAQAELIKAMVKLPAAKWIVGGTPAEAEEAARETVLAAKVEKKMAFFVTYNIPYRDCAGYSAGGAKTTAEYQAWIDGVAAGIGRERALVLLEPDSLGIIPNYTDINGNAEWCKPEGPGNTPEERFAQLNYAVDSLRSRAPNALVYLDATHSGWLGVGDAANRLSLAGIERAQGFFLNVSNYQFTANLVQYGTWVSKCLASGSYAGCANQYWNGGPAGTKIADLLGPWTGVGLRASGEWSDTSDDPSLNTSGINQRFGSRPGKAHFVIDTSRNGQGPWVPPSDRPAGDPQDWCNPPDRGLGLRSTCDTGNPLVDAYLWGKVPGESDGQCFRWTSGPTDPARGMIDPPAGAWFDEQALELVELAVPPLL